MPLRVQFALQRKANLLQVRAQKSVDSFVSLNSDLMSGRADQMIAALYELSSHVLTIARLRDVRASLTSIHKVQGALTLRLRTPKAGDNPTAVLAAAVVGELESVRSKGLDCTKTRMFALFKDVRGEPDVMTYASIRHQDLLKLYDKNGALISEITAKIGGGRITQTEDALIVFNQAQLLFVKGLSMLGKAVAMQQEFLALNAAEGPSRVAMTSPPDAAQVTPTKAVAGTAAKTLLDPPAPPEHQDGDKATPAPEAAEATPLPPPLPPPPSPTPSAQIRRQNKLDAERAKIVAEVTRQTEQLRAQRGPTGMVLNTNPIGVANNLLTRLKRLHQVAEMLVAESDAKDHYTCTMSEGRVEVTYAIGKGSLSQMLVRVDELYEGEALLSWQIKLKRKNDQNFTIRSEFDGIKASMVVDLGELESYPNFQQLMVLMNRLTGILNKN